MKKLQFTCLMVTIFCLSTLAQSPGDFVITEWMANPAAVGDADGEYAEFYNNSGVSIDINGWVFRDDDSDIHTIDNGGPLVVAANDFVVLGKNTDMGANGGYEADYAFGGDVNLANGGDEIVLETGDGTVICRIAYSNGDPEGAGVAMELSNVALHTNGETNEGDYVPATMQYGAGDWGSPGSAGNTQGIGGGGDLPPVISGSSIMRDPFIPEEDEDIVVSAEVTDDSEVALVELHFIVDDGDLQTESMVIVSGDTYEGFITEDHYGNGSAVEYWIYAEDDEDQPSESSHFFLFTGNTDLQTLHAVDDDGVIIYDGYDVRSAGVATVASGTFSMSNLDVYIQDATGGINVFAFGLEATITRGNDYEVEGTMDQFNGKAEIVPADQTSDIQDNGAGVLPTPMVVSIADLLANAESYEGMLLQVNNVSNTGAGDPWPDEGSFANVDVSDGTGNIILRIDDDTNIDGSPEPVWPISIIGVGGQWDTSAPFDEGYQVQPRDLNDLVADQQAPAISGVTRSPRIPAEDEVTNIEALITDDGTIAVAEIHYTIDDGAVQMVAMGQDGNDWTGEIPESAYVDGSRVTYWVYAEDDEGISSQSAAANFFAGTTPLSSLHENDSDGVPLWLGWDLRAIGDATAEKGIFSADNLDVYMQDATGGINVFQFDVDEAVEFDRGTSYEVIGVVEQFNGKVEIVPDDPLADIANNGNSTVPDPVEMTIAQFLADPETYEGMLIKIDNLMNTGNGDAWPAKGSSANLEVSDDGGTSVITLRIDSDTDIDGSPEPLWAANITGILNQFDADAPYDDGYQLQPRDLMDIDESVGIGESENAITVFALNQNYPNPFNPSTIISYQLPVTSTVDLSVYDLSGRLVINLVNSEQQTANRYEVSWNGTNSAGIRVASGVYVYRMTADGFEQTRKMLLVR